ncbi:MAG: HAD-IA family hydrolase [Desulfovibrio sp.]|nr:HAD-IA family hydrolase [Desulfovibrio sp.]
MSAALFLHGLAGVVFDCDGVMIDSREANTIFYNRVLAYFGLPPMTAEQERYSFMATAMQALLYIVPPKLHSQIGYVVSNVVLYDRDIVPLLRLKPGFKDFIDELHSRGVRMAVHTNRTLQGMQTVLDIFSLPSYFSPVVAADMVTPKPSPEGAVRICEDWGCNPTSVLFVGDSNHDKMAAEGAGLVFAAMGNNDLRGQITVRDFKELRAALADVLPPVIWHR